MAAPTVVKNGNFNVGNKKQVNLLVTLGASSGIVQTGLKVIDQVLVSPVSITTAMLTIGANLGSQSTTIYGTLSLNSGASGDAWYVTCYGR